MPVEYVGRPVKRLEDPKLVTGADPYVNDVRLDGALVMAVVRSPHAHDRLVGIDTRPALTVRGVVGAWNARELLDGVGVIHRPVPDQALDTIHRRGHTLLAEEHVRYVGQPVAVVVAESVPAAADGAEAVAAGYDSLPAVVDAEAALADAPLLYPDRGSNGAQREARAR
jgi:carbon-monoxide dehydrogenase large subunit